MTARKSNKPLKTSGKTPGKSSRQAKLVIRNATIEDVKGIQELYERVYPGIPPYPSGALEGQIRHFAEGQFVAVYNGQIVGYCATIELPEEKVMAKHTWREITGNGFGTTHDSEGDYLYGVDIFVDPALRGLRIGERLYQQRKELCKYYRLKGIVFGGRLPLLQKKLKAVGSVENYLELVKSRKLRDPVLGFQLRQGYELLGVLENYLPVDHESLGYASHMVWRNPVGPKRKTTEKQKAYGDRPPGTVRLAAVQYQQRSINTYDDFVQIVQYFVDVVADYRADFVVFPELFTLQLLSIENEPITAEKAIEKLSDYTDQLRELFSRLAIKYNVNIIGGSHPTRMPDGTIQNISIVCLRDGATHEQAKIHPTPNERYWWNIQGGDNLNVIDTDCGPIGVLICYDAEFPELGRYLIDQGAMILFVPFCTDERQSYLRVRYSCQARAIENQCYVVMAGNVGNLPRVYNMDIQYAQSCILTPCDFPFARDGIAADTTPNVEMVAFADLHIGDLYKSRSSGTVQNLKDRRHELYSLIWHKKN